jgi:putative copper export protein
MVFLRIIHILSGVFWVGGSLMMVSFIQPAVVATGAEGQKFMQQLGLRSRLSVTMAGVGVLTFLSGLIMYGIISDFRPAWMETGYGATLTVGAIFGTLALISGFWFQFRATSRMRTLMDEIQAAGGPPKPEQMAEIGIQARRLQIGGQLSAILMTLAVIGMAAAQYITF